MKKATNEAYYSLYCKWQESGQTKAAFAALEGIPKATFHYWCKKFDCIHPTNPILRVVS
jgi:hypothetical protein